MDNDSLGASHKKLEPLPQSGTFRPLLQMVHGFRLDSIRDDWSALSKFLGPDWTAHLDTADQTSVRLASPGQNLFLRPGQWLVTDGDFTVVFDDLVFRQRYEVATAPVKKARG